MTRDIFSVDLGIWYLLIQRTCNSGSINARLNVELGANDSTFIPVEAQHRIENIGDQPLVFIEVQYGEHLSEEDIVRLEDSYGRA